MKPYIGRFAPSPSGPLHAGSLVAALASYLDARAAQGQWLVRIEDIDPPREVPGASDLILSQLEAHGLHWDGEVSYQSQHQQHYLAALENLAAQKLLFACCCSRERLRTLGGQYDGRCRHHVLEPPAIAESFTGTPDLASTAIRIRTDVSSVIEFDDLIQGPQRVDLQTTGGDFIVRRRDQLFAYQLAVAVDDLHQGISHVIRGDDLLSSTPRQLFLIKALSVDIAPDQLSTRPVYGHVPVVTDNEGQKLSKQNKTPPLDPNTSVSNLYRALLWLNQDPPPTLLDGTVNELLSWAIEHWQRENTASARHKRP